jgi:hypothetical protein
VTYQKIITSERQRQKEIGKASWDLRCPFLVKKLPCAPIAAFIFNKPTVARPTALRPDNEDSVALVVLVPPVLPRVKQPDERAAFRIKSTQVRYLASITVVAGESEVFAVASSDMLRLCTIPEIRKYGGPTTRAAAFQ